MLQSLVWPLAATGLLVAALPALAQHPVPLRPSPISPEAEQVVVELRVVSVSGKDGREAVAQLFQAKDGKACGETACCSKPTAMKTAFLDGAQLKAVLEKCQQDRPTTVMQAPKVTLFDGQVVPVSIVDPVRFTTGLDVKMVDGNPVMTPKEEKVELGTSFRVTGKLSADRKHVKLDLKYHDKQLASPHVPLHPVTTMVTPVFEGGSQGTPVPFTQFIQQPKFRELSFDTTVAIPDGGTLAVHAGKQTVQVRSEFGPPVLSQIPYLNRLFKNVGIGETEQDVVVLATAKRVVQEPVKVVVNVEPLRAPAAVVWPATRSFAALTSPTPVLQTAHQGLYVVRASAPLPSAEPTDVVAAYHAACAKGDKDAAMRLAVQALAQDPTCFGRTK
jgi:Bacterial type II and III secretion system protein